MQGLQVAQSAQRTTDTAAAVAASPSDAAGIAAFESRLHAIQHIALRCEDPTLQERARAVMPLARLRASAAESVALAARLGSDVEAPAQEDELARGLLGWFKTEFFSWVNTLPCSACGCADTLSTGLVAPSPDDLAGGASRVELHACPACGAANRFPRYNEPGRLLQPGCRRGRCGEWANAFLLCCRAAGLTARYVSDWADHVWTEYYSHRMRRWVHLDSCEASYDKPLLYEQGWRKEVLYVVAAGAAGIVDVTPRYTARWREYVAPRRNMVPERWLARTLDSMTEARRAGWPGPRRTVWLGRDAEERVELLRCRLGLRPGAQLREALPGRQTGSVEWRQQRGEIGSSVQPPTSYRVAPDGPGSLPALFSAAGRLSGGAVRAAGHNEVHEVVERLFDGRSSTKWLDFGGGGSGGSSWVEYLMPNDLPPVSLSCYELISANDSPERDPAAWRLEGVTEADWRAGRREQWTPLDTRTGVRFPGRFTPLAFSLAAPSPPCRRLRLAISATAHPALANSVQLACWNLYGSSVSDGDGGGSSSTAAAAAGSEGGGGGRPGAAAEAERLQRLREAVAASNPDPAALALLGKLLGNVRRDPSEHKYRKLYDTADGPPASCDGGVLLSVNGLRALQALDPGLYNRLCSDMASPVHEALWFDLEASPSRNPDPAAPPLLVGLHELREALCDALPLEVDIFGRHHVRSVEASPSGGALLHFAASPSGSPVRSVQARLVVGADGARSAVRRLQFDSGGDQQPQPSGRTVWRGRFTLRPRDPDFARLRNFATASRTWVDLRAQPGCERSASLSPAGPNVFVWTASCPTSMLPSRGLQESAAEGTAASSPYWRCLAMFEDFSQDFFAALRATAGSAVAEYDAVRPPSPAAAASLAAPWQWYSGAAALVGEAVWCGMPADDAASTAMNLALEDAAVLGSCLASYGMGTRALQEYARQRGPRVSSMLALPPSAPERLRMRDAPFLPSAPTASTAQEQQQQTAAAAADGATALTAAVEAAVNSAASASVAAPPPMAEILAKAAAAAPEAAALKPLAAMEAAAEMAAPVVPSVDFSRPSGGASRTGSPGGASSSPSVFGNRTVTALPAGPSSPIFSRPSGARRMGPVPNAIAAVVGLLIGNKTPKPASAAEPVPPAATAAIAHAPPPPPETSIPAVPQQAPYASDSTPHAVWDTLLAPGRVSQGQALGAMGGGAAADAAAAAGAATAASGQYCSVQTPAAVWEALLVAPQTAHSLLVSQPYKPEETPALVWAALLGAAAATAASASAAAAPAAPPSVLLPRPVPKAKSAPSTAPPAVTRSPAVAVAASTPDAPSTLPLPQQQQPEVPTPPQSPSAARSPAAASGQVRKERRSRGQASGQPTPSFPGASASGLGRKGGKASKRPFAPAGTAETTGRASAAPRPHSAASKARAAAKAAATMTMSLSAAAALGGVISAGGGHMPMDVASAMHVHGAVAQFWDDLNNLTLSSASLSSIDV
ncbi:hypothetical protein GPECTOR_3g100 [Gonium pectorale]|uniref:Transglutaminase-like domain-containing protein n=1 Tax=Gonium pectorale TaxID=33097 RepID=A0A150H028_GONPE|nr:hypothetical protein GPECTOR_3g100 [Gonium pectorale]|eukprot:KXZ54930.1 hypothetical protein GPECTOR_3g100 [Gonium pectorale]